MRFFLPFLFCTSVLITSPNLSMADHGGINSSLHWNEAENVDAYRSALFHSHQTCSRNAQLQVPSASDAAFCSEVFLFLKLSFLPDTDPGTYKSLAPRARAAANRKGYQAYMDWLHRNIAERLDGEVSKEQIQ